MFKKSKKKEDDEEELDEPEEDRDEKEEDIDEESDDDEDNKSDKDKKFMAPEQYEEYLLTEQARIQKEIEKVKTDKENKTSLSDVNKKVNFLGSKVKELEEAVSEMQRYIKLLWNDKKI